MAVVVRQYLVVAYAYLVKAGRYQLEPTDADTADAKIVPEAYREPVAEYIAEHYA